MAHVTTATPEGATMLISRLHAPVTTLGPGVRAGIWTQGCTVHCRGCVSVDTWGFTASSAVPVSQIAQWLGTLPPEVTGVTISGGEPFDQPAPLLSLLEAINAWRRGRAGPAVDVLCYSGYPMQALAARWDRQLRLIDAVIAGPYRPDAGPGGPWIGSANQRLHALTALGEERMKDATAPSPALQVDVDPSGVWMVGVPAGAGDMERLRVLLASRGVRLRHPSWAGGDHHD